MANTNTVDTERALAVLSNLTVRVEAVDVVFRWQPCDNYPSPGRPTSTVFLSGNGLKGSGELVGWSGTEHEEDTGRVRKLKSGRFTVRDLSEQVSGSYARTAVEGAALDLALKQSGANLASVLGIDKMIELNTVVSFEGDRDVRPQLEQYRKMYPRAQFKIDVHPDWDEQTFLTLKHGGDTAILDFKLRNTKYPVSEIRSILPLVLFEDPIAPCSGPVGHDKTILNASAPFPKDGECAVNIKAPRVGGFLEAMKLWSNCVASEVPSYAGGMFEVGPGRRQARKVAALFCPDAPNDLAPHPDGREHATTLKIDMQEVGF